MCVCVTGQIEIHLKQLARGKLCMQPLVAWADRSEIGIPRTDPNLRGKATLIAVIFEHAQ